MTDTSVRVVTRSVVEQEKAPRSCWADRDNADRGLDLDPESIPCLIPQTDVPCGYRPDQSNRDHKETQAKHGRNAELPTFIGIFLVYIYTK